MWYPVSDTISDEPVTIFDAQAQVYADEPDFNDSIMMLISAARAHAEAYCNRQFATHEMIWACDSFADFVRLPAAPLVSVSEVSYIDISGDNQVLDSAFYDVRADGLDPSIAAGSQQTWPAIAVGSRVTLTGVFGGGTPADVKHAMLLLIGDGFEKRENAARPGWTAVDALLANHRRGAW